MHIQHEHNFQNSKSEDLAIRLKERVNEFDKIIKFVKEGRGPISKKLILHSKSQDKSEPKIGYCLTKKIKTGNSIAYMIKYEDGDPQIIIEKVIVDSKLEPKQVLDTAVVPLKFENILTEIMRSCSIASEEAMKPKNKSFIPNSLDVLSKKDRAIFETAHRVSLISRIREKGFLNVRDMCMPEDEKYLSNFSPKTTDEEWNEELKKLGMDFL